MKTCYFYDCDSKATHIVTNSKKQKLPVCSRHLELLYEVHLELNVEEIKDNIITKVLKWFKY